MIILQKVNRHITFIFSQNTILKNQREHSVEI